jgi:DNA replication licensing factor MCM5
LKDIGENIDLMTTILSRFDCIFIVRDVREYERDRSIARHVLGIHLNASATPESDMNANHANGIIDAPLLKKYVAYCRERCAPRLNDEAAAMLSGEYVHIRSRVRESLKDKNGESQVVPITVRQLEALIRISESLAKMRLSAEATVSDVVEAIRLFRVSTLNASESNPGLLGNQQPQEVKRAEEFLRSKIGYGELASSKNIMEQAVLQGHSFDTIKRAIAVMIMKGDLQEMRQRNLLKRLR